MEVTVEVVTVEVVTVEVGTVEVVRDEIVDDVHERLICLDRADHEQRRRTAAPLPAAPETTQFCSDVEEPSTTVSNERRSKFSNSDFGDDYVHPDPKFDRERTVDRRAQTAPFWLTKCTFQPSNGAAFATC